VTSAGCSLLTPLSGYSSGDDALAPAAEAGPTGERDGSSMAPGDADPHAAADATLDAAADADASTDGPPPSPNLYADSSFETSCAPFGGFQGDVTRDKTAHTGSWSCRACTRPTTTDYFTADDGSFHPGPVVGATYRFEAWVRSAPGAPAAPDMLAFLRTANVSGQFTKVEEDVNDIAPLTSTWQHVSVTLKVTAPAERIGGFVGAAHAPDACFLLDDVVLRRIQ